MKLHEYSSKKVIFQKYMYVILFSSNLLTYLLTYLRLTDIKIINFEY